MASHECTKLDGFNSVDFSDIYQTLKDNQPILFFAKFSEIGPGIDQAQSGNYKNQELLSKN